MPSRFAAVVACLCAAPAVELPADPPYYRVSYPPSKEAGELPYGVTYMAWVPPGVKTLRAVIVHQHGCGVGACKGGETAAYDLHWQALAKKWDCALLGPSYQQPTDKNDCRAWSDPRRGSGKTYLRALRELGVASHHPELDRVPWCLWGHSGGANWVGTMALLHPDRTAAVWLRSGSPRLQSGDLTVPDAAYGIPMMANLGAKEKEGRFARIWETTLPFVRDLRAKNAPVCLAVDPRTSHECGDSRYLAVPYLDACLELRLPDKAGGPLKPIDVARGVLEPVIDLSCAGR